jgi:WD40 repeat protein/serine/threonine protein kinase
VSVDRHERVGAIFAQARRLDPDERAAFLDTVCTGDAGLRAEIESLLAEHRDDSGFLDTAGLREKLGAIAAESIAEGAVPLPERVGPFRILRVIGEGGMGTVYEAEQDDPKRRVAVKVIRPGMATRGLLQRFRHEAHVLGRLRHPGIAQVYRAGTAGTGARSQPYFAMELVTGRPLLEHADHCRLSPRQRLELIARVCDALHHAHQNGVVHRDLKPANILVEEAAESADDRGEAIGQPKILDFGIARATDADTQTVTLQTNVGQLIGTLPYMSPEQAAGDPTRIDIRSDVYSLGVIAYELLTGRLPYDVSGSMIHEVARIIREEEPTRLSSVARHLRGDVETIVAKALAKEKDRRYQSASEFAADIRRCLRDEPIVARPTSALYQLRKFARRNRALVSGVSAGLVIAFLAMAGATIFSLHQARIATAARDAEHREKYVALAQAYRASISAATAAMEAGDPVTAQRHLDDTAEALRQWEWRYLAGRLDASIALVEDEGTVASGVSADGRWIVTVAGDGTIRWHPSFGQEAPQRADLGVRPIHRAVLDRAGRRVAVIYGPDHHRVGLWAIERGKPVRPLLAETLGEPAVALDLAPDGRRLAATTAGTTWVWDPVGAAPQRWSHGLNPFAIAMDAPGGRVALARRMRSGRVLSLYTLTGEPLVSFGHARGPECMALAPDGGLIATGGLDKTVRLHSGESGEVVAELHGHSDVPRTLDFSPDGRQLVSAGRDRTLRLWDVATGTLLKVLSGHAGTVRDARFTAGGSRIVSRADDGSVRLWDATAEDATSVLRGHDSYVYAVAFSPDGSLLYSGAWDSTIIAWDAETGERLATVPRRGEIMALATSPDGRWVAAGNKRAAGLTVLDARTLTPVAELAGLRGAASAIAFTPGSDRIVARSDTGQMVVWEALQREPTMRMVASALDNSDAALRPDGLHMATTHRDGVRIWDLQSGQVVMLLPAEAPVHAVAWNPAGSVLASADSNGRITLWDPVQGTRLARMAGHTGAVYALVFSPDGSRLASGANDTTIRLWDLATREAVARLRGHQDYIYSLAFSPDGSRLASGSGDFTVRLWDTALRRERWAARAQVRRRRDEVRAVVEGLYEQEGDPLRVAQAVENSPQLTDAQRSAARQFLLSPPLADSGVACDPFAGGAVRFGGGLDHVLIGASEELRLSDPFTIEAWVRPGRSRDRGWETIINKEGEYQIALKDRRVYWTIAAGSDWIAWVGLRSPLPEDRWTHVALVRQGERVRLLVNGRLVQTVGAVGPMGDRHPDEDELRIGGRQREVSGFQGAIDEVRVWSVARSIEQIRAHMTVPLRGDEPGLVGYWRFDEGAGTIARDATGRHHGAIAGATWIPTQRCPEAG